MTPQSGTAPVGIIGTGRLGCALACALHGGGRSVMLANRDEQRGRALAATLGAVFGNGSEVVDRCPQVFLTVPDDALANTAASLSFRGGQAVVHCSGALGLGVLEPARRAGAQVGCMHPLQSFPADAGAEHFQGIVCGIEAAPPLNAWLRTVATSLGARTIDLGGVDRARYHAAAVLTSNYLVALHAAAEKTFQLAGLAPESAREALSPLTQGAAANIARLPLAQALTGPIARGDLATVQQHLQALDEEPAVRELYARLGRMLLSLPLQLDAGCRSQLLALLSESEPPA